MFSRNCKKIGLNLNKT